MQNTHYHMENKKDIGTIFREQLNHLDKTPNDDGWNIIQSALDRKKKRKVAYFWFIIVLVFSTGILSSWLIFPTSFQTNKLFNFKEKEIVIKKYNTSSSKKRIEETDTINSLSQKTFLKSDQNLSGKSDTNNILSDNLFFHKYYSNSARKSSSSIYKKSATTEKNLKIEKTKSIQINEVRNKYLRSSHQSNNKTSYYKKNKFSLHTYYLPISDTSNIDKASASTSLYPTKSTTDFLMDTANITSKSLNIKNDKTNNQDSILKKKIATIVSKNDTISKITHESKLYSIYIYSSPTSNIFSSKNSTLDSRLNTNSKKSKIIINYGSYVNYQATENLSIRFGFGRNKSATITEKALINTPNYSNIEYKNGFSNTYIFNQSNNSEFMKIVQEISYSEIPIEIKYNIIKRKIGLNAIIGLNYLFLSNNEVSVATESGYFAKIGKTSQLLSKTFGTNIGIGIDYKISPRIKINIEPMLKYQLNSKNNLESSKAIDLNILTGLEISLFSQK
ncbi:hypothetical protein ACNQGB_16280 [Flavobacterium sp. XS1P32]|uniref:hypothetical protein n=2 Tax=unclassified Flavobacterium TaxID=196869 RepID=UPI003AB025CE